MVNGEIKYLTLPMDQIALVECSLLIIIYCPCSLSETLRGGRGVKVQIGALLSMKINSAVCERNWDSWSLTEFQL